MDLEEDDEWILKNLESDEIGERLFAVFLLSKSQHKDDLSIKKTSTCQ